MTTPFLRAPILAVLFSVAAAVGPATGLAEAQTSAWTGTSGDGLFTTAGNWNPSTVPGASSDVVDTIGGNINLNANGNPFTIASLSTGTTDTVNTTNGSFNVINGAQLNVAGDISVLSSDQLTVVGGSNAFPPVGSELIQQGGTLTVGSLAGDNAALYVASNRGTAGTFTSNASTVNIATYGSQLYANNATVNLDPSNANSVLNNSGNLFSENMAILNVDSGIVNNSSIGTIAATNQYLGYGTFINGNTLNNAGTMYSDGGTSNLPTILSIYDKTVNNTGFIFAGDVGGPVINDATVNIGTTNFNNVQDTNTGAIGLVSAQFGSQLNLTTTNLTNNAGIDSSNDSKGVYYGTTVNLNVSGSLQNGAAGSIDTSYGGQLTIDGGGTGTLNNAGDMVAANFGAMHSATITVENLSSPVVNTGSLEALTGGDIQINGDLTQSSGLTKVDGQMEVTGTFRLEGGVLNGTNGTLTANVVQTGGVWNPGEDPSSFNLVGSYTQNVGGILQMDIASSTSFDTLNVSNGVTLNGGTLNLDFLSGYIPTPGTSWHFLTAGSGTMGNFGSVTSNLTGKSFLFDPATGMVSLGGAPPVPETGTATGLITLVGASLLGMLPSRRRTKVTG